MESLLLHPLFLSPLTKRLVLCMPCIKEATLLREKKKVYRAVVFEEKMLFRSLMP